MQVACCRELGMSASHVCWVEGVTSCRQVQAASALLWGGFERQDRHRQLPCSWGRLCCSLVL